MKPIKFLFVSDDGLIGDIAWQAHKEGHDVLYDIENKLEADIADGFVPKTDDWRKRVDWADVIIFDDTLGMGVKADKLRRQGKAVIGGTPYTDRLEEDRSFGQEELKRFGIPILSYQEFTNFDDAIRYVHEHPEKYVIKPSGEAQNIKRLLFVGQEEDGSDVIRVLEAYKRVWSSHIKVFQIQKRVSGVEIAVGAFFNGKQFVQPINVNFEFKKLFPGNLGPSTGDMGATMFWSGPNRLFNQTIGKMESKLAEERFVGYVDLNCIVNGNGIYPLEFTPRFGYPTISVQQEGMITPIGEFLADLAYGRDPHLKVKKGFQIGIRVVVPPFPYRDKKTFDSYSKGATVVFKKKNLEGIHIEDVKLTNDQWVVTGSAGVALIVAGTGTTMKQAQQQAYNRIQNILIPNMYYRMDIGDRWYEDNDKLHTWGYLREA
ncbi:MAG: phosphoribosylglycinamide synthetase C domain-containing protein [bacterium]|nr:phosphoribosylglycinamide synthetase C domain-containing protein [bacterium]